MIFSVLALTVISQAFGAGDEARIARVEKGLLPPVVVKGNPEVRWSVEERMQFYRVPGVSLAFIDGGRVAWTRAYGYADTAAGRPVTEKTRFQAASLSKPTATLGFLRLVQEGTLSLDEDVNARLRTWKVAENRFTRDQRVTLRRILSHSAGLTIHGFDGYAAGEPVPSLIAVLEGRKPANSEPVVVEAVPGSRYSYSGGGFTVAQQLVEDVVGRSFESVMADLVLRPLGMRRSAYSQPLPADWRDDAAHPYEEDGSATKGGAHTYPELAAAGLWTTPTDLAQVAIEVQNAYAGHGLILSSATAREMLTDQREGRGLGFSVTGRGRALRFAHTGSNAGFKCLVQAYAATGQGIVIMTNGDGARPLQDEILRAVAREYGWPDFKPEERELGRTGDWSSLTGVYGPPGEERLTVSTRDGRLLIKGDWLGRTEVELFPDVGGAFFTPTRAATFTFEPMARPERLRIWPKDADELLRARFDEAAQRTRPTRMTKSDSEPTRTQSKKP